jgi:hypothetical protein
MKRLLAAMTAALLMVSLVSGAAFASSSTPTKGTGQSAPLFIPAVQVFPSTPISGGNTTTNGAVLDTRTSFVVVDTNVPITGSGILTSWSFYAGAVGTVTLDIVRGTLVVAESAPVTVGAADVGTVVTTALPNLAVLGGDNVGLYFTGAGVVPFDYSVAAAAYTAVLSANPAVGETLVIDGYSPRTYSVSVTGKNPSPYDNACQVLTATGKVNWIQPKGNVDINLGISTAGLAPLSQYTVYLDEGGWPVIGTFTTDAYGNGSLGYSVPGGTLSLGTHTWRVYINGPAGSACAGYTVLVSAPIIFTVPGV